MHAGLAALAVAAVGARRPRRGAGARHRPAQDGAGRRLHRLDVRVPNERDDASTTKVAVQLPPGFASAPTRPSRAGRSRSTKEKLATPVQTDDGDDHRAASRPSSGPRQTARRAIPPGEFHDFPLSVAIPGKAGDTLTFKALQTYSNGEVVRWIGAPDADQPAPQVKLTAATTATATRARASRPTRSPAPAARARTAARPTR